MTRLLDGEGTCGREIEGDGNRRSCGAESADSVLPRGTGIACGAGMWAGDASCFNLAAVDEELKGAGLASLTPRERGVLARGRARALGETERVEFGEGPTVELAKGLAVSAFVGREELPGAVATLEAAFYRIKDETLEACPDEEAVEALLAAVEEFAGDADAAGEVAAERSHAQWTPQENPWSDGGRWDEEPYCIPGSSLPGWALDERLLSVGYVLSAADGESAWDVGLAAWERDGLDQDFDPVALTRAFDAGVARIHAKAAETRVLCERVRRAMPCPTSRSMRDTLGSISLSFDRYDPVLSAHAMPYDIDYQLALPVPDSMLGVDYVHEYLCRLALENDLLARCDPDARTRLLDTWMPDWRDLVANLYEPVALAALRATDAVGVWTRDSRAVSVQAADEVAAGLGLSEEGRFYLREFARQNRRLLR